MRTITVTYTMGERECIPMIRLRGKWLKQAGFDEGTPVQVTVDTGKLTLTVAGGSAAITSMESSH